MLSSLLSSFSPSPTCRHSHNLSVPWQDWAPAGVTLPRIASLHGRAVLIPLIIFSRVQPVPRETVILKHRRAPGSQSRHSPKVCVPLCSGLRDESSGESFCWPSPSLFPSCLGPASDASLPSGGLRTPTGRVGPPGVPYSPSALWTRHPHTIQVAQAEEFSCAFSARDYVSTVLQDAGRISFEAYDA